MGERAFVPHTRSLTRRKGSTYLSMKADPWAPTVTRFADRACRSAPEDAGGVEADLAKEFLDLSRRLPVCWLGSKSTSSVEVGAAIPT
jgi:hypothetical protein